ncbi:MAG TPA: hypothetical protein VMR41_03170 [Patescibacteria group bacterium]|nr:hypothetical protein [Patescibacteria group bacterium]
MPDRLSTEIGKPYVGSVELHDAQHRHSGKPAAERIQPTTTHHITRFTPMAVSQAEYDKQKQNAVVKSLKTLATAANGGYTEPDINAHRVNDLENILRPGASYLKRTVADIKKFYHELFH